jgi:hypothetical protein
LEIKKTLPQRRKRCQIKNHPKLKKIMDWRPKLRGGRGLYLNKKTFGTIFINCQNSK